MVSLRKSIVSVLFERLKLPDLVFLQERTRLKKTKVRQNLVIGLIRFASLQSGNQSRHIVVA